MTGGGSAIASGSPTASAGRRSRSKKGKEKEKEKEKEKGKDPLSSLSNEELEKLLKAEEKKSEEIKTKNKKLGKRKQLHNSASNSLSSQNLNIHNSHSTGLGSKSSDNLLMNLDLNQDPITNLLDLNSESNHQSKEDAKISSILSDNRNALRKFHLKEKEAFSILKTLKERKFFSRLPTYAKNIILVRNFFYFSFRNLLRKKAS